MTRPNNVASNYSYDNQSHLLSVLHQLSGSTIDGATYTVDSAGNRTAKTDNRANVTSNYGYDAIYELLQTTQGGTTTESYTYDPVGNRLSLLGVSPYSYNSSNELTSTPSASYTYDNNGNTLTKTASGSTTNYTWDYENRLATVVLPGTGGTAAFKYDPFGRRIQKVFTQGSTTTTTNYLYDNDNSVQDVDQNGNLLARYAETASIDELLAGSRSSTTSYYEQDGVGSITSLSSSAGALANTYTFDSFGKLTASSGSITNRFQYTAREFDTETCLYFYRARYYDPSAGRFLSEDPLGSDAGPNAYTFVGNDPVIFVDPLGLHKLKGFSPSQQNDMNDAIKKAIKKLTECPSCAGADGSAIANTIQHLTFIYVKDLRSIPVRIGDQVFGGGPACADAGELKAAKPARVVLIGGLNWDRPEQCHCGLASIIAHEASHKPPTNYNHPQTDKLEEVCFGCKQAQFEMPQ